jgi:hypothetical protein
MSDQTGWLAICHRVCGYAVEVSDPDERERCLAQFKDAVIGEYNSRASAMEAVAAKLNNGHSPGWSGFRG